MAETWHCSPASWLMSLIVDQTAPQYLPKEFGNGAVCSCVAGVMCLDFVEFYRKTRLLPVQFNVVFVPGDWHRLYGRVLQVISDSATPPRQKMHPQLIPDPITLVFHDKIPRKSDYDVIRQITIFLWTEF